MALLQRVCRLDLEGVVAKQKFGPYVTEREQSTWLKILNREYSQKDGREELFERERHSEPVPGWHSCVLACVTVVSLTQPTDRSKRLDRQMTATYAVRTSDELDRIVAELSCLSR